MTRDEKILILTIGEANRMAHEGLITAGHTALELDAIEIYNHLIETDFAQTLTPEERLAAANWLQQTDPREPLP